MPCLGVWQTGACRERRGRLEWAEGAQEGGGGEEEGRGSSEEEITKYVFDRDTSVYMKC